jgi:hypothetical protein
LWSSALTAAVLGTLCFLTGEMCVADNPGVRVTMGGHMRAVSGRWALLKAVVRNSNDVDAESVAIVIPQNGADLQFAARVVTPANTMREFQWPVWIPVQNGPSLELDYIVMDGSEEEGVIQRRFGEEAIRSFGVPNPAHASPQSGGFGGWLTVRGETRHDNEMIAHFLATNRIEMGLGSMIREFAPEVIDGYPEGLDSLDQLVISTSELTSIPEACEAVGLWIQRGGQAVVMVDQTGTEVVSALLGDGFPLSLIDTTTTNSIDLVSHLKNSGPADDAAAETLQRTFDEPVTLVRAIVESGTTLWSADGWPVAVELPLGKGRVFLTFLSAEAFLIPGDSESQSYSVAANGHYIRESVFGPAPQDPLVEESVLVEAGVSRIGYEVPTRSLAAVITLGFSCVLLVGGVLAVRRFQAESLIWVVPLLALLASVPAAIKGIASRNVAPATTITQDIVEVAPGQTSLAITGLSTFYQPEPQSVDIRLSQYSILGVGTHQSSVSERMVWSDRGEGVWKNPEQPAGILHYPVRSVLQLNEPSRALATFDENGLTGTLTNSDQFQPEDCIVAGLSPDYMSAAFAAGDSFRATADDMLPHGVFSQESLLSDEEVRRGNVYNSLFRLRSNSPAFPQTPSLLFWSSHLKASAIESEQSARQESSVLLIQPIQLTAPAANTAFVIPATFLPYQAVQDAEGGVSAAYGNRRRVWQRRKSAGTTLLEFTVPKVCQPFVGESVSVDLRISAGSREVSLLGGPRDNLQKFESLESPVGLFHVDYPAELLQATAETGKIYLQIEIGDVSIADEGDVTQKERDDFWEVDRVMMTARGTRVPERSNSLSSPNARTTE